jgi:acetylornithine deacetylase/succinyl-diaminopimelate desuccinylase family protein
MNDVLGTLAELVRIGSVNPAYEGGVSEAAVASYVREFFAARGIEATEQEVLPGRANLLARLPGSDPGRRIVLEAHMDTAGISGMAGDPFEPAIRDGRMYGRGSCDTKAGLAAMMHAVASVKADGIVPRCEVLLAAAIDEEFSFQGVLKLREGLTADAAIVAEPTSLRLVSATKGVLRFRVRTAGKAAHSSKPHLGVNAVNYMARVVTALEEHAGLLDQRRHPMLGPATFNTGLISGGTQINIVPEACTIEIDRRLLPGESPRQVWQDYRAFLQSLSTCVPGLQVEAEEPMMEDLPLETASSEAVVAVASRALGDVGLNPEPAGVPYGSDASKLSAVGIPSIVFGPGSIDQAHAAVEFVDCEEVRLAERFFRQFIMSF